MEDRCQTLQKCLKFVKGGTKINSQVSDPDINSANTSQLIVTKLSVVSEAAATDHFKVVSGIHEWERLFAANSFLGKHVPLFDADSLYAYRGPKTPSSCLYSTRHCSSGPLRSGYLLCSCYCWLEPGTRKAINRKGKPVLKIFNIQHRPFIYGNVKE